MVSETPNPAHSDPSHSTGESGDTPDPATVSGPSGDHDSATFVAGEARADTPTFVAKPGLVLGQYRIEEKLGEGGMGTVWKATHLRLGKIVALKLLPPQLLRKSSLVVRFEREMRAVGMLSHPHLVQAFDAGDFQGAHCLAMEFVDGVDLSRLVRRSGPVSPRDAVSYIRQAAQGLGAAHEAGLVHRDIKPGNLMLAKNGTVKVMDLGLARLHTEEHDPDDATLTSSGQILGTPDYIAPEQWDDTHNVDARCDQYALGCTLHFLLTGRPPFAHQTSTLHKMKAHATNAPPDLSDARSAAAARLSSEGLEAEEATQFLSLAPIPPGLVEVHKRLLAKAPTDRYANMQELARLLETLEASLSTESGAIPASPAPEPVAATAGDRHGRGIFCKPVLYGAGFAAFLALLAGVVIILTKPDGTQRKVVVAPDERIEIVQDKAAEKKPASPITPKEPATAAEVGARAEPPPLEDWLKGRKILTVKQDGTAMYKTIQAAIDAQKAGEVVEVLDQGPYFETLSFNNKTDSGLVTRVGTVVVGRASQANTGRPDAPLLHTTSGLTRCRLAGFTFVHSTAVTDAKSLLYGYAVRSLCIENCVFLASDPAHAGIGFAVRPDPAQADVPLTLRDCVFEPAVSVSALDNGTSFPFLVSRNWWRGRTTHSDPYQLQSGSVAECDGNVFTTEGVGTVIHLHGVAPDSSPNRFRHNTIFNTSPVVAATHRGTAIPVEFLDNLLPSQLASIVAPDDSPALVPSHVRVARNRGGTPAADTGKNRSFPLVAEADRSPIRYLSTDPADRNYLRLDPDWVKEHVKPGDPIPGALPPGPCPDGGDWFTRLQERYAAAREATQSIDLSELQRPPTLREPDPLEEWLAGRTILTVKQDGTAMYKSIQAALDAQKDGEVVEVLDQGPYVETLNVGPRKNCGLISRVRTIVDGGAWRQKNADQWNLHVIDGVDDFRLSGLTFRYRLGESGLPSPLSFNAHGDCCVEDCVFVPFDPRSERVVDGWLFLWMGRRLDQSASSVTVRRCVFDLKVMLQAGPGTDATHEFRRNWWVGQVSGAEHFSLATKVANGRWTENIFSRSGEHRTLDLSYPGVEVAEAFQTYDRNTFVAESNASAMSNGGGLPGRRIAFTDNLLPVTAAVFTLSEKSLPIAQQNWTVTRNFGGHAGRSETTAYALAMTDELNRVPIRYLSTDPADRNYLRLDPDWVKEHIKPGDPIPGALPPGPCPEGGDWFTRLQERYAAAREQGAGNR